MDYFKGLKVVEFASVLAGPAVGMFFAELGADVIKIENRSGGDLTRHWKQSFENPESITSAYYHSVNWNKTSIFLDLTNAEDYIESLKIISDADIIILNFKSGDAKKLKLENDFLQKKFPSLIIAEICGYDDSDKVAYDAVLQAETGFMSMNGTTESGPLKMPVAFIDLFAAHQLKEGILIALLEKNKTGKGAFVSVSLYESAIASLANQAANWLNNDFIPELSGSLHPNIAPYGEIMTTNDDQKIVLAVGTDQQFLRLCILLDIEEIASQQEYKTNVERVINRKSLADKLQLCFSNYDAKEIIEKLNTAKIPAGKINNLKEVFESKAAQSMILKQTETDDSISKRVSTIAFKIKS